MIYKYTKLFLIQKNKVAHNVGNVMFGFTYHIGTQSPKLPTQSLQLLPSISHPLINCSQI